MNNRYYQKGIVIPTLVISLLALFAIAGLAMDMSNHYLTKTLIQNALDASALSGAKVLNDTGDTDLAEQAALRVFNFRTEFFLTENLAHIAVFMRFPTDMWKYTCTKLVLVLLDILYVKEESHANLHPPYCTSNR